MPAGRERAVSYSTGQPLRRFAPTTMRSSSPPCGRVCAVENSVALQWGDLQLGGDDTDSDRFIWCSTTTCGANTLSLRARTTSPTSLSSRLPRGRFLDPDNLYHRVFLPVLAKAGIRKIRLHDLCHTFGSLLLQNGASIVCVKEEMGHWSFHQISCKLLKRLVAARGLEPRTYGL